MSSPGTAYTSTVDTPVGPFTAIVSGDETVLASGWTADVGSLLARIHPTLRPAAEPVSRADLGPVSKAVLAYHEGDPTAPDGVPVRQYSSGGFLTHAWDILRTVPAGEPITYTDFAAACGRPAAVRAAAQACARNTAGLFVPCHRIVPAAGGVGGFRWGPPVKRWLLDHEARLAGKDGDRKLG